MYSVLKKSSNVILGLHMNVSPNSGLMTHEWWTSEKKINLFNKLETHLIGMKRRLPCSALFFFFLLLWCLLLYSGWYYNYHRISIGIISSNSQLFPLFRNIEAKKNFFRSFCSADVDAFVIHIAIVYRIVLCVLCVIRERERAAVEKKTFKINHAHNDDTSHFSCIRCRKFRIFASTNAKVAEKRFFVY